MVFNTDLNSSRRDNEADVSDVFQLLLQAEMLHFVRLTLQVAVGGRLGGRVEGQMGGHGWVVS